MATVLRVPRPLADGVGQRAGHRPGAQGAKAAARPAAWPWTSSAAGRARARSSRAASIENAIAAVAATGGSTNAVLHLLAIAHEAGVALDLDDFDRISARVPVLADLKPSGRFVATDLYRAGGTRLVARRLVEGGLRRRRRADRHGPDARRGGGRRGRGAGAGGRAPRRPAVPAARRPRDPHGQPRARRRGRQDRRPLLARAPRPGARVRQRGGGLRRRAARRDRRRATSW